MNKAFTRETDGDEDDEGAALPAGVRNYMTPAGWRRLREELMTLLDVERPKVVEAVSWAANKGDRSENVDEADNLAGEVSWISPIARSLLSIVRTSCFSGSDNGIHVNSGQRQRPNGRSGRFFVYRSRAAAPMRSAAARSRASRVQSLSAASLAEASR